VQHLAKECKKKETEFATFGVFRHFRKNAEHLNVQTDNEEAQPRFVLRNFVKKSFWKNNKLYESCNNRGFFVRVFTIKRKKVFVLNKKPT
jgi:hypothetical protein